jgi:hypothetical protein
VFVIFVALVKVRMIEAEEEVEEVVELQKHYY